MTMIDPSRYQAVVVKAALRLYAKTGMKANSAYTPKNMMAVATKITGKKFKARDYLGAADALEAWIQESINGPVSTD